MADIASHILLTVVTSYPLILVIVPRTFSKILCDITLRVLHTLTFQKSYFPAVYLFESLILHFDPSAVEFMRLNILKFEPCESIWSVTRKIPHIWSWVSRSRSLTQPSPRSATKQLPFRFGVPFWRIIYRLICYIIMSSWLSGYGCWSLIT
jgi:hypothetical protein